MNKSPTKDVSVRSRVRPELKERWAETLAKLEMTESDAIRIFVNQVVMQGGMPFDVKVPNAETRAAMAEDRSTMKDFSSSKKLFKDIESKQE